MALKKIGFFRELQHGDKTGKSLKVAMHNNSMENENEVVKYLNSGIVFCVTAGLAFDVLDESAGVIGSLEILTDGTWAWPSDLLYYVKKYHVELDTSFIEYAKEHEWTMPSKDKIDLLNLEF